VVILVNRRAATAEANVFPLGGRACFDGTVNRLTPCAQFYRYFDQSVGSTQGFRLWSPLAPPKAGKLAAADFF